MDKTDYIGRRIDWEEIVELFPDRWVAITDCNTKNAVLVDGKLLAVFTDSEVEKGDMLKYVKKGINCRRTTSGMEVGYIHGRIIEKDDSE